jgi:alkylation response protein AidB-like acyl-CoA dehydrogenase
MRSPNRATACRDTGDRHASRPRPTGRDDMRLTHTDEQRALTEMLRDVFAANCPPSLVREMRQADSDGFPSKLWQTLAGLGVLGLSVDPEYGGGGASLYELGLVYREAGRVLSPTILYSTLDFSVALGRLGDAEQKSRYLPPLSAGTLVASTMLADPSDAGDLRPRLQLTQDERGWLLSGELLFVSNGASDVILAAATSSSGDQPDRVVGVLINPGQAGCAVETVTTFAGDKQSRLRLDGYVVSDEELLRGPDRQGLRRDDLRWVVNACLALQCMEMVGGATVLVDRTAAYISTREQFGRPIGGFQVAQHHIADMRIALERARLSASQAVWWLGQGDIAARRVAIANMQCSEAYKLISWTAHQLHGGMGFVQETGLHLWSERAKVTEIRGGTADVAAGWLARVLGLV